MDPVLQIKHHCHKPFELQEYPWYTIFILPSIVLIGRCGVVGKVPSFQPSFDFRFPGGVRNFNSYPGIGCVSFVCVLSWAVSGRGPDIVLNTHSGRPALVYLSSVLVHRQLHLTHGHLGCKSLWYKS